MKHQFVEVAWDETHKKIICRLPLTSPTGKVRVKRDRHPIATRQTPLQASDVIEWQIAYRDAKGQFAELGLALRVAQLSQCKPRDIVGRTAKPKEFITWSPTPATLKALVKAFGIASKSHRDDMLKLLTTFKEG